jgi:ribosomal protein L37AE/L43A
MKTISQNCPKCSSNRIRRGYRHTPLWSKFLFRYNLLCDECNWEFKGFAVPGTVTFKPKGKRRMPEAFKKEFSKQEKDRTLSKTAAR